MLYIAGALPANSRSYKGFFKYISTALLPALGLGRALKSFSVTYSVSSRLDQTSKNRIEELGEPTTRISDSQKLELVALGCLKQSLRIFRRALQTFQVFHISMDARKRINQTLVMVVFIYRFKLDVKTHNFMKRS